jgi:hypothetical protein
MYGSKTTNLLFCRKYPDSSDGGWTFLRDLKILGPQFSRHENGDRSGLRNFVFLANLAYRQCLNFQSKGTDKFITLHTMKAYGTRVGIYPCILKCRARWRLELNFMLGGHFDPGERTSGTY